MCRVPADDAVSKLHPGPRNSTAGRLVAWGETCSGTPARPSPKELASQPARLACQACLRVCSVVPNLGRPTPPPEGPPPSHRPQSSPARAQPKAAGAVAPAGVHRLPMLTNTQYSRYYAQPLSVSHSFLPPVSLFRPPLQVGHSFFAAPHPSQPTVASWREEDLTVFVPSFGIPTLTRRDCSNPASHLRTPSSDCLSLLTVCNQPPIIIILPPGSGLAPRHSSVPRSRPCKIIPTAIPLRRFHTTPQSTNSHYFSKSETGRLPTSNVPRHTD